ncbi:MAG: UPF0164 family protein, partial [Elusimicrobia bacterium]|nr:UPF0164 family protein [Elusimicrobiota bacterium]
MLRQSATAALFYLSLIPAMPAGAQQSPAGSPGQIFDYGGGARALAMGGAFTAVAGDAESIAYNPAGLALLSAPEATLMHQQLFGGASYDMIDYARNYKRIPGSWGAEIIRFGVSGAQGRDALNNPTGSFSWSETALDLASGLRGRLLPDLSLGADMRLDMRSLANASDTLYGASLGAQYGPLFNGKAMLGMTVHNLAKFAQGRTSDSLPTTVNLGASYRLFAPLLLAFDVSQSGMLNVGGEYTLGFAALRAGYGSDGISFGAGLTFKKNLSFDVAMLENSNLGLAERASLTYRFRSRKKAANHLSDFAEARVKAALKELQNRRYVAASTDFQAAIGLDWETSAGWRDMARRLKILIDAMNLENHPEDQKALAENSEAAALGSKAVGAYLDRRESDAMVYADVAAGASGRAAAFMALLDGLSAATRQEVVGRDIMDPKSFIADRMAAMLDDIYRRKFAAAEELGREAALVSPDDAAIWMRLGSAYFADNNTTQARQAWAKSLALAPNGKL